MSRTFDVAPFFDDYLTPNSGGLAKNYYKVLFRPGRALQARELTTAQTILQNQLGSFGKFFFPEGASIYGANKFLYTPLDYVIVKSTLTDTTVLPKNPTGDGFLNFKVGDVIKGATSGITAVIQFVSPAEAGTDPDMIFVKYLTANTDIVTSVTTSTFLHSESLTHANSSVEIAVTSDVDFSYGHGISVNSGIIFTKELFIQTTDQSLLFDKFSTTSNSRVGYVVTDKIISSLDDVSLKDNAQGYPNYSADGADRHQISLQLCSLGYDNDWVANEVVEWTSGVRYHKNRKTKLPGSSEVFVCIQSHVSTLGSSSNRPVSNSDSEYWVQAINFIEICRIKNGGWITATLAAPDANIGFSKSTYDTLLKLIEKRDSLIHGDFTIKPFGLKIKDNDTSGINITNNLVESNSNIYIEQTVANTSQLLLSVDFGHAFKDGHEVITQTPEFFVLDKPRTAKHVKKSSDYSPEINYGNYMLLQNVNGYFDIQRHETVSFYNANTHVAGWSNTSHEIGTAKIRYFDINSGRKTETANTASPHYPTYRAYLYNFKGIKPGEARAIKGAYGHADTKVSVTTLTSLAGGNINVATANVYGEMFETGLENKSVFQLNPNYVQFLYPTNTSGVPIYYTYKDFDAKFVRVSKTLGGISTNVFELRSANTNALFTEADFGSELGNGLVNPMNEVDLAEANYTLFNMSSMNVEIFSCGSEINVTHGNIIPEDAIAGESNCDYKWTSDPTPKFSVYFATSNVSVTTIPDIKLRVKMGILDAVSDKKVYNPCITTKLLSTETSTHQGYNSKEISLFEPDVYSLDAVYMAGTGNTSPAFPTIELDMFSGTFLGGETFYEVNSLTGIATGVTGKLIANIPSSNTWTFIPKGSINGMYTISANNFVIGDTSGSGARIPESPIINAGFMDITGRYELDNGQRDNYYDWAKIKLLKGKTAPTAPILIVYSKFDTQYGVDNEKTFYSINSYGFFAGDEWVGWYVAGKDRLKYSQLPLYSSSKLGNIRLRDAIDFRPARHANTTVTISGNLSNGLFSDISNLNNNWLDNSIKVVNPSPRIYDTFKIDYNYFLDKKASVTLNKNYDFEIIEGQPGSIADPVLTDNSLLLWKLYFPPYLDSIDLIEKTFIDNRVYQMKDIGAIDTRLTALEKIVKLNVDELKAMSFHEPSTSALYLGLERFKNGILLDTFTGHSVGDVQDPDYKCSIEPDAQTLRAPFESQVIDMDVIFTSSGVTYHPINSRTFVNDKGQTVTTNDGIVTLNYQHVSYLEQRNFTSSMSVNPYNVTKFVGKLTLDPESDNWMDTQVQPTVEINLTGDADAWNALTSSVNSRLVVTLDRTPLFSIGSHVTSNSGGGGTVSAIEDGNNIVLIDYEGSFYIGSTLVGIKNDGSGFSALVNDTWERGGAPGFGTQFGDWQTQWTGVNSTTDISATGTSRTVVDNQTNRTTYAATGQIVVESNAVARNQSGTITTDRTTTNTTNIQSNSGTNTVLGNSVLTQDMGEKVVDVSIIPYIRTKDVLFDAVGLKPNTRLYPFFNGISVSQYCSPRTLSGGIWILDSYNSPLISDSTGKINGIFKIPGGVFATGERTFRLIDDSSNDLTSATTNAEAGYVASGLQQTKVDQIISTRVPTIERRDVSVERKVTTSSTDVSTSTSWNTLPALPDVSTTIEPQPIPAPVPVTNIYNTIQQIPAPAPVVHTPAPCSGKGCSSGGADPLAQTFFINLNEDPTGVFITAIDVYVAIKAFTNTLPLVLDVRTTVNGYPSQYTVPGTSTWYSHTDLISSASHDGANTLTINTVVEHKMLDNQYITLLNDTNYNGTYPIRLKTVSGVTSRTSFEITVPFANVNNIQPVGLNFSKINIATLNNNWVPTKFVFECPIYLAGGEYSFVVRSTTEEYEIYLSTMGKNSLRDSQIVTKQPAIGSMFRSQNSSTWTPDQESDLAFNIWRASFDTSNIGDIVFTQNDLSLDNLVGVGGTFSSNFNVKYNLLNLQTASLNIQKTKIEWYSKMTDLVGGLESDWAKTVPNADFETTKTKVVYKGSSSIQVRAMMNTGSDMVSPVVDLLNQRAILVENIINNNLEREYEADGGCSQAKYISRSVILDEGMDAVDISVHIDASKTRFENSISDIRCYGKILASGDEKSFHDRFWYPLNLQVDPGYSTASNDYKKYDYKFPKNIWFVNEGGNVSVHYTGDGVLYNFSAIDYEESQMSTFLDAFSVPLEHLHYDDQTETMTYTYYDGVAYPSQSKVTTYNSFKQYSIKIVMLSDNKSMIPLIKGYKALALT